MKNILQICLLFFFFTFTFANGNFDDFEREYENYNEVFDPLSGYNKIMTNFNVTMYDFVFNPFLKGYNFIMPRAIRLAVKNFFDNLLSPLRFVSNALQFKFARAGEELKRFGVNTIMGFGGLIDSASAMGLQKYPADLGTVLAHWGVGGGFHIVLPFLGPSNLRDTLSLPVLWYSTPIAYLNPAWLSASITTYGFANEMSFQLDQIDELYHNTPKLYPFLRDAYEQRRKELSK
ncbi:MlaA family lipoprotein [Campylobacter sp. MIT 21-1685]|uniref:MlaA family lipoprotein n=1 Tax=unclassified Campylobacter TaxID=2593542 RepID=UPI00224B49EE|nr:MULTISPECIES: MlaA family lipoprotein [unclassified Campylobacter]MCX2683177.1 MlaA family lipoprotein [Campylobacter sp. MIT 21-1684]MCX2751503.1 MlaA family lipoprotein [Campylobacter sp. MIT 21-1682]MCX2807658.1 MlaA family lipoprotein [Campylobacter sp. MIT 21-1685]